MKDVIIDALLDTLKVMPFLLIAYLLIELIEHKASAKFTNNSLLRGKAAPVIGAAVGIVPQCGFSVMATNLYAKRCISVGTLLAVYIATSDEAIPILLSNYSQIGKLLPFLIIKLLLAILVGVVADLLIRKPLQQVTEETVQDEPDGCCKHSIGSEKESGWKTYVLHPVIHCLKISAFILAVNFALGVVLYYLGEERLVEFLGAGRLWQPFIAGLIGLIPNCAGSVVLTQLYVMDAIGLGSAVAGLSVNAGIALAVLFRLNKNIKQNFAIIGVLYGISVLTGFIISLLGF